MAEYENQQPVAEIEVGGPISFNTSMNDLIEDTGSDESLIDDRVPSETIQLQSEQVAQQVEQPENQPEDQPEDQVVEEEPVEQPVEQSTEQSSEENPYDNYSEAALVAEALRKKRPDMFSQDGPAKEMEWDQLIEKMDTYIGNTLQAGEEYLVNSVGEIKEYVEYLMKGGDPKVLEKALSTAEYSKMDIDQATDEQKEDLVKAMYRDKGLNDEEINSLVENHKLAGKLDEKAKQSKSVFDTKEKDLMKAAQEQKRIDEENRRREMARITNDMKKVINSGNLLGMHISERERKELEDAMLNPTEVIEIPDGKGGSVVKRLTKYQVMEREFKNNLEMQIAFGKLLLDGFDLGKIKQKGAVERDKDILDVLNKRKSTTREDKTQNAYLTPVAEYDI